MNYVNQGMTELAASIHNANETRTYIIIYIYMQMKHAHL